MSNKQPSNKKASTSKVVAKNKTTSVKTSSKKPVPKKNPAKFNVNAKDGDGDGKVQDGTVHERRKPGRPKSAAPTKATPTKKKVPAENSVIKFNLPNQVVPTGIELPSATSTTAATGATADSVVMSLSWQKSATKPTKWQRFKGIFKSSKKKTTKR